MGKLIFFDIDGTLAMPGQPPGQATVDAIRAVRANGHKVFLSTGRLEADVAENIRGIGFDGGIYSAGGRVVVSGKEIFNCVMQPELVRQIADVLEEYGVFFMLETADGTYEGSKKLPLSGLGAELEQFVKNALNVRLYEQMPEHTPVYKVVFHLARGTEFGHISERLSKLAKVVIFYELASGMTIVPGEISDPNINKGIALDRICQYLNVASEDCIAFGDSMNDLEILRAAGLGIAMGNAEDSVKELADRVCGRCDEDGIAKALAELELSGEPPQAIPNTTL